MTPIEAVKVIAEGQRVIADLEGRGLILSGVAKSVSDQLTIQAGKFAALVVSEGDPRVLDLLSTPGALDALDAREAEVKTASASLDARAAELSQAEAELTARAAGVEAGQAALKAAQAKG